MPGRVIGRRVPRPERSFESDADQWLTTRDSTTSHRFDLLRKVNAAGRVDLLVLAGNSWGLLEELVGEL